MERQEVDGEWKKAFEQAEVSPSDAVWTNIELDLERAKGTQLRRRLVFFQMLAAASVIFSLGVGVGMYVMNQNTSMQAPIAMQQQTLSQNAEGKNNTLSNNTDTSVKENQPKTSDHISSSQDHLPSVSDNASSSPDNALAERGHVSSSLDKSSSTKGREAVVSRASSTTDDVHQQNTSRNSLSNTASLLNDKSSASFNNGTGVRGKRSTDQQEGDNILAASGDNSTGREAVVSGIYGENSGMAMLPQTSAKLPALVMNRKVEPQIATAKTKPAVDPVALMLARLQIREEEMRKSEEKEKKEVNEKLWTSVGFAAGAFNPTNTGTLSSSQASSPSSAFATNRSNVDKEIKASGVTYSVGVNMGTKVARRWVVQGGVNYLTQSSDYITNAAVAVPDENNTKFLPSNLQQTALIEERKSQSLQSKDAEQLVTTAPYNINNNVRYLSIPLQAGYLLVNKEFGLQLNAGVSTDLFLQNTVTTEGQNLQNTTQNIGEESPYRTVNMSGLLGTEVSYRFGTHYRIALNPGMRYPFNSIYRSEMNVKAMPLSFDVGLRFRYIFH